MKKLKISFILLAVLMPFYQVVAQQLENIPGQDSVGHSDLIGYLNNLYKFGISITGILAVFMIALGAFSYIVTSAGNSSKMMNAKEMINNALIGLVIVLTAYLFLYVINPDLVGGTLTAPEELIEDLDDEEGETEEDLADGTPCNDGSYLPSCSTCPSCATCENGYHTNSDGDQVCGPSPSETAEPDAVGCCVWDSNSQCNEAKTKTECEDTLGGNFTVGTGSTCDNTATFGSPWYKCEGGIGLSVSTLLAALSDKSLSSDDKGCCQIESGWGTNDCKDSYKLEEWKDVAESSSKIDSSFFDLTASCEGGECVK